MGNAQWAPQVTVANEYTLTGSGSLWGRFTAGLAALEVKNGATPLSGRTTLYLQAHPDNTGYIYIGFSNAVSATNYAMILTGGEAKQLTIPSTVVLNVWAIGSAASQFMAYIEGKP